MKKVIIGILFVLVFIIVLKLILNYEDKKVFEIISSATSSSSSSSRLRAQFSEMFGLDNTRDFFRYECKNLKRIGGMPEFKKKVDALFRMEGAWYACLDDKLDIKPNECTVLSFGINVDESFDDDLDSMYKCRIESFDPFTESPRFQAIRAKDPTLKNEVSMKIRNKWTYHKIGLVGTKNEAKDKGKPGWMATIEDVLEYLQLKNQVIDIFKMDIENSEWSVLENMDLDYACKYFKQIAFETHIPNFQVNILRVMRRLEKCFLLFRRDPKFYKEFSFHPHGFLMTEWQLEKGFLINIKEFKNENNLSNFILTIGEFYFVNENFLNQS